MKYEARIIEEKKIMKEKEKLCMIKKQQIERTKTEQKEIKKEEIEIQGKEELNKTEKKIDNEKNPKTLTPRKEFESQNLQNLDKENNKNKKSGFKQRLSLFESHLKEKGIEKPPKKTSIPKKFSEKVYNKSEALKPKQPEKFLKPKEKELETKKESKQLQNVIVDNCNKKEDIKKEANLLQNIPNKKEKEKVKDYKIQKYDFNYLKINIKNNENNDIELALNKLMKGLKIKIKEKYDALNVKVNFDEENDFSFNICYEISPMSFDGEVIEFLDDEFEKKVTNSQNFVINVELVNGDKNFYSNNILHKYCLIFKEVCVEKEDFYEHMKILKNIVKNLLIKK